MSYTRHEYDVFISYAHVDDVRDSSGKGWVEQFQEDLREFLPQRLGGNTPSVFFDRTNVASNHQLAKLRAAARNSAVLLAVASPNYAARPWTREELQAFTTNSDWCDGEETRLFAIECLEPDDRSAYPPPLDSHIAMPFWEKHGSISLPLRAGGEEYRIRINQLASDIAKKLRQIRDTAAAERRPVPVAGGAGRAVLLAQATDDLEEACEQVKSYLAQFGVAVLPAEAYPQGGEAFRAAFAQDLARASVFVQLLSASPGRRPPDMPEGYTAYQAGAAMAAGVPVLQWRSPELRLEGVGNAEHRRLLGGEHVIVDSLEGFKATVERRVNKPAPAARPATSSASVFIDASLEDLELARQIQSALTQPSGLPVLSGPPEAVRADLEENMLDCDVLVLVNGQNAPFWVRGQLRLYNKLRGRRAAAPKVLEVVVDPPENKDHGMRLEELQRFHVPGTLTRETLRPVLEALDN